MDFATDLKGHSIFYNICWPNGQLRIDKTANCLCLPALFWLSIYFASHHYAVDNNSVQKKFFSSVY